MLFETSLSHQRFTLISRSAFTFTVLLITLYSSSFWFDCNAANYGLIAVLFSLVLTHYALLGLESYPMTKFLSPLLKGKPYVIYRRWLKVENNIITFGLHRLLLTAVESISLTPFGNLLFRSRALSGSSQLEGKRETEPAPVVLKIPFSAISLEAQKNFIALIKTKYPQIELGSSLESISDKPILKSTNYIQSFSTFILLLVLLDVGNSTFSYVELLKRYYLCSEAAHGSNLQRANEYYSAAEELRTHPFKISLVNRKLLYNSSVAASLQEERSIALWSINKKEEALQAQNEAIKLMPFSFKYALRQARLYSALGQRENAKEAITSLIEKHKHALLPHIYLAAILWQEKNVTQAKASLKDYFALLNQEYFSPPPIWPPGGEEVLHELFHRDDFDFLQNIILDNKSR